MFIERAGTDCALEVRNVADALQTGRLDLEGGSRAGGLITHLRDDLVHVVRQEGRPLAVALVDVLIHDLHAADFGAGGAGAGQVVGSRIQNPSGWNVWRRRKPSLGRVRRRARDAGLGTHVSEKDFLVSLCRLETAMRAASCEGGRRVERQRAVRGSGRRLKARRHATWLLREKSVAMGAPGKRSRGAARGVRGAHTHLRVVRMLRGHGRGGLRGELVELPRGDALVHAHGHLLGDEHAVRRSSGRAGTGKRSARGRGARKGRVKRGRSVHGCATDSCTSSRAG